ncbi:cysteine synthase A [Bdellovibrio bacteriovorus]|uniref:Cysteine synthase A n=1 Tax=Bdellovibrio bacteriovorus str. Tiberius TaxID=1069642 RepID=K7ZA06_BDEBC|nr:cysteine synthase A [Bdellovibrio bacteriovorus]AFY01414.1 cysteine synthase A [Bdellovibrio bacteriovorus str. Tiberius]
MQAGSVSDVVGHTPLIKLQSLSKITGCEIFAKAEYLNPGGSVKDRTALGIIQSAEKQGLLKPGYTIVEGTAGNTGIGLATLAAQRGYRCVIVMPDNQAKEKYDALHALGVELVKVAPCPFANPNHFYHTARTLAESRPNAFWANQFENTANFEIHYKTTGPEVWAQMDQKVDAFVSSVGTGGTLAGVSAYLKEQDSKVHTLLADPMGSGLYSFVKTGKFESQGSSITEGIGIMRLTENFKKARVDEAVQIHDEQMLSMLYYLAQHEGLLVGTSAALNIFAAYQYALQNQGKGLRIATVMGDSALRYQSKVFNPDFLKEKNLQIKPLIPA